jgi:hypothetical protein
VILVVGSANDQVAESLAAKWRMAEVRLVRPADILAPGWCHFVGVKQGHGMIALGGEVIPEKEITGVLTRLPWVSPVELVSISGDDREYVAAELSAFLLSWLTSLDRPVVNRPTPGCLAGPPWRAAQWVAAATVAGLVVSPKCGTVWASPPSRVTVVGSECFGDVAGELCSASLRLAALASVDLLDVFFDGTGADAAFIGVNAFPPLDDVAVCDAVLTLLQKPAYRKGGLPDLRPWRRTQAG